MIWVTGARGMLGTALTAQLDRHGIAWFGSDLDVNISDAIAIRSFLSGRQPSTIFNCAAYTAVDAAEIDESTALEVNGNGPKELAKLARETGSNLIHVSTDYVFDGSLPRSESYTEGHSTSPINAYGRTKLAGEVAIAEIMGGAPDGFKSNWIIVRTSWLFGAGRSSFVDTMWRLMLEKDELNVVDDQFGRPTYVVDLAETMLKAAGLLGAPQLPSGVWHFCNQGSVSWCGFASAIREQMIAAGQRVRVERVRPIPTEEYPRPAKRPKNSVLSTARLEHETGRAPRPWQDSLSEYINLRLQRP